MAEKCVCHINGYRLKDTEARRKATTAGVMANAAMEKATSYEKQITEAVTTANKAKNTADRVDVTAKSAYTAAKNASTAAAAAAETANSALPKSGGTMTGDVNMNGREITNALNVQARGVFLKEPNAGYDVSIEAMTEPGVVHAFCAKNLQTGVNRYGSVIIRGVSDPVYDFDAANKKFVQDTVNAALEGLNVGSIGYVDGENNIIINTQLPAGEYSVRYEMEDGSTVEIGKLVLDEDAPVEPEEPTVEPEEPTIVNLAEPNSDNTTDFSIWCNNARIGSDGAATARDGYVSTNFFAVSAGDVIRFKNFQVERIAFYDESKSATPPGVGVGRPSSHITNGIIHEVVSDVDLTANTNGEPTEMKFTIKDSTTNANIAYCRLSGHLTGTAADVMITANQEIE